MIDDLVELGRRTVLLPEEVKNRFREDPDIKQILSRLDELSAWLTDSDDVGPDDLEEIEALQKRLMVAWGSKLEETANRSEQPVQLQPGRSDCPFCGADFEVPGTKQAGPARLRTHIRKLHPLESM